MKVGIERHCFVDGRRTNACLLLSDAIRTWGIYLKTHMTDSAQLSIMGAAIPTVLQRDESAVTTAQSHPSDSFVLEYGIIFYGDVRYPYKSSNLAVVSWIDRCLCLQLVVLGGLRKRNQRTGGM